MAVARDRLFPKEFGKMSKHGVPAFGIIISSVLVTLLTVFYYSGSSSLILIFNKIILLAGFTVLVPYAFCAMSELVLFIKNKEEFSGKRLLGSSVIAVIAFVYSVWTIYGAGAETVLLGFILLMLGIPVYVWMLKQRSDDADAKSETPATEGSGQAAVANE